MKNAQNQFLKTYFEHKTETTISRSTWYRIKTAMIENDLAVTIDNIDIVIAIKKQFPDNKLSLVNLLKGYLNAIQYSKNKTGKKCSGETLFQELRTIVGLRCDESTIIRWFKDVKADSNGYRFNRKRKYEFKEVYQVYLRAYAYVHRYRRSYSRVNNKRKYLKCNKEAV